MKQSELLELSISLIVGVLNFYVDRYSSGDELNSLEKENIESILQNASTAGKEKLFYLISKRTYCKELGDYLCTNHPAVAQMLKEAAHEFFIPEDISEEEKTRLTYLKMRILLS